MFRNYYVWFFLKKSFVKVGNRQQLKLFVRTPCQWRCPKTKPSRDRRSLVRIGKRMCVSVHDALLSLKCFVFPFYKT